MIADSHWMRTQGFGPAARRRLRGLAVAAVLLALAGCADRPPDPGELAPTTAYGQQVSRQIAGWVSYPFLPALARKRAVVFVMIAIGQDGELKDNRIGYTTDPDFNDAALAAVRRAAPFPPPPELPVSPETGEKRDRLVMILPIAFKVR